MLNSSGPKSGLSIGEYLLIATINLGLEAVSKRGMWSWFQNTVLLNHFSGMKKEQLSSQPFWDHMNLIPEKKITPVWLEVLNSALTSAHIESSSSELCAILFKEIQPGFKAAFKDKDHVGVNDDHCVRQRE